MDKTAIAYRRNARGRMKNNYAVYSENFLMKAGALPDVAM